MSASARLEMIRKHPNRSRLEAVEKAAAHRAANPPPIHGPQDLDNPLSFLTAYDHLTPAMPLRTSPNLPAYNRMILTPSEQFELQSAFGDLKQLLLNRVLPPRQAIVRRNIEAPNEAPEDISNAMPDVFSTEFRTQVDAFVEESEPTLDQSKDKQLQHEAQALLRSLPKNKRFQDTDNPFVVKKLHTLHFGGKRGREIAESDDAEAGPSSPSGSPAKKARFTPADALGIFHDRTVTSSAVNSHGKSTARKTRKPATEIDPLYKPASPDLAQEAADDALEPDEDDLAPQANSPAPRKGHKNTDPAYRYTKPDRAQEAADDAIRPDFDDITPSKPTKPADPTYKPSPEDDLHEQDAPTKAKGKKKAPVKRAASKKTVTPEAAAEQDKDGAGVNMPANAPGAPNPRRLSANRVIKKPFVPKKKSPAPKKTAPKPVVIESDSGSESNSDFQSQPEQGPKPEATPAKKAASQKTEPGGKQNTAPTRDTLQTLAVDETAVHVHRTSPRLHR